MSAPEASAAVDAVTVSSASGSYPVVIGSGIVRGVDSLPMVAQHLSGRAVFVVSSQPILDLHERELAGVQRLASTYEVLVVPDGEAAKCAHELAELWRRLLASGGKRDSVVVAFGGGSVGDLAGFAAASFLRGVDLLQVPTTLLAQVDSSVGGKTGIDLKMAKNSVGAFHAPVAVLADTALLHTLPAAELRAGLIETIKMAALLDADVFRRIERDLTKILQFQAPELAWIVRSSVEMKADVVQADERESGARKLLNFGHTFGHALESVGGYLGLRHGEAVGYGMLFALDLAAALRQCGAAPGLLQDDLGRRLRRILSQFDLPALEHYDTERLLLAMSHDKKARAGGLTWVLPEALGRGALVHDVDSALLEQVIERFFEARR